MPVLEIFIINIFYQNVRGLLKKIPFLRNALLNVNYNIICLTETWLNDNVFDSELGFTNYNLYRNDRNNLSYGKKTRWWCSNCSK